jgi:adenylate cyclase
MDHRLPAAFSDLLLRYSQEAEPARRAAIEARLWRDYGCERAVLVVDMSGFSELTHRHGIVHYLSMVRRMQLTAEPIISGYEGVILKFEADNAFAMFPTVAGAVRAALELNAAFAQANRATPDELDIRIACGIDVGPILVVDGRDFFGDAVNVASKLGEDLAQPDEVLLSRRAWEREALADDIAGEPLRLVAAGLPLEAVRVRVAAGRATP